MSQSPPDNHPELSTRERVEQLRAVPAFKDLPSPSLEALADLAEPCFFSKGEEIFVEGDLTQSLYFIVSGRVKMFRHLANGRNLVLALFHPGEHFGTAAALGARACDASIVALDDTSCLSFDRAGLFGLLESRPELITEILPALTRELVECNNCIVEVACHRVETRLAHLLLKFTDSVGQPEEEGTFIPIPLSRQELADMTGTTIETCIRILSRRAKERVVDTLKNGFLVRDRTALEGLARDS